MSFTWTRQGDYVTSVCTLCGHTARERDQRAILDGQRAHDAFTCQMRRAERARAVEEPIGPDTCPEGHERAGNTYVDPRHGTLVCNACRREDWAAKKSRATYAKTPTFARVFAARWTKIGTDETASGLTPKPPLSTPDRSNRKEDA